MYCVLHVSCNVMNLEPAGCKNNFVVDGRSKLQTIGVELGVIKGTPYFCHLLLLVHACTCIYDDPHLRKNLSYIVVCFTNLWCLPAVCVIVSGGGLVGFML